MNSRMRSTGRLWPSGLLWAMAAVAGLLGGVAGPAEAGWTSIGPYGGDNVNVTALAIDPTTPTTVYAGTLFDGGVFKTTDGGGSWSPTGLAGIGVRALAIDPTTPTTVYAGTQFGGGVFKTTDGGGSWSPATPGLPCGPSPCSVRALALDPTTPTTLYAGTALNGVFKSTDGGASWSSVSTGLACGTSTCTVDALALDPTTPTTLYAGTVGYVGIPGGGVFKTTDGGGSWSAVNTGLPCGPSACSVPALALDPTTPTTLYAGMVVGVFKTTDGGGSWSPATPGLPCPPSLCSVPALALDPTTPTTVYAGTAFGVFKSTDGGASWSQMITGLVCGFSPCSVLALALDPTTPTTLYAGTSQGVFKTTTGGTSWSPMNTGLASTSSVLAVALALDPTTPTTLYAGGSGVFKTTDGGGSWSPVNTGLTCGGTTCGVAALAHDPTTPTTLYAGTDGGVFKTTTGGTSWSAATTGLTCGTSPCGVLAFALDPTTPTTLYAGTDGGVFKTTTGGTSWSAANTGLTCGSDPCNVDALALDPTTPTTLYAGTSQGVFKSTDGGGSWSAANTGLPLTCRIILGVPVHCSVAALALDPTTPTTLYAGTVGYVGIPGGGVFKSTDGGGSWSAANTGLPLTCGTFHGGIVPCSVSALALDPTTPAILYAGTDRGVFKTTTGGTSWSPMNTGLTDVTVHALALDPTTPPTLYAGTADNDVFKWTCCTLTVGREGGGEGTVASSPPGIACGSDCGENYAAGTTVTLTATPSGGSSFTGWSGECTGTGACVVSMDEDRNPIATFTGSPPTGGGGGGGGCFIATAAYGSALAPHVQALRDFRDAYLMTTAAGKTLVALYETYSPPFAARIARHENLKWATRAGLTPVVYTIRYPVPAGASLLVTIVVTGWALRTKRPRVRRVHERGNG